MEVAKKDAAGAVPGVQQQVFKSLKRTYDMFLENHADVPAADVASQRTKIGCKIRAEYDAVKHLPPPKAAGKKTAPAGGAAAAAPADAAAADTVSQLVNEVAGAAAKSSAGGASAAAAAGVLAIRSKAVSQGLSAKDFDPSKALALTPGQTKSQVLALRAPVSSKPKWHPPWKLYRVVSGHTGWVRCLAVEPGNQWFCSGSADRTIKIWDLASGTLKLSLTGHISTVRGLAVSPRHPYLFSAGEDKTVKCWDLEYNKVIRHYHGHLSGVFCLALHPTIDVLATGGRDSTVRVWDIRTKANVHTLTGHSQTVACVEAQGVDPQITSGSMDSTVKLWDLAAGKCRTTLTNHKKSVRALAMHAKDFAFASASADNVKQWRYPDGKFVQNMAGSTSITNGLALNKEVLVSGADNGHLNLWDWRTGHHFQTIETRVQPGSLESENGILALTYDRSGSRFITAEADKTIKFYKEDDTATEETHPLRWKPTIKRATF